jgi:hypothetical protein
MDGEYRKYQVSTILSEAEARVGELQPLIPIKKNIDQIEVQIQEKIVRRNQVKTSIKKFECNLNLLFAKMYSKSDKNARDLIYQQISEIRAAIKTKREELRVCETERYQLVSQRSQYIQVLYGRAKIAEEGPKAEFFMACPGNDCRGRLSTAYKCGLCEHWFCPDCHSDKGHERQAPHECNKDDKDTVTLLKQNTKPCPKCHEGIFKVSGCDQMWCTRCHTCFSWNTNKILNGTIHNPHYYAYQRQMSGGEAPRVAGDVPCGGIPELYTVRSKYRMRHADESDLAMYISGMHRLVNHLIYVCLPVLRHNDAETIKYRKLGVEYLNGDISRDEWGQKLYLVARKRERKQRLHQVLEMATVASGDIFRNWMHNDINDDEIIGSMLELVKYVNEQIDIQNVQYGTKLRHLDVTTENYTVR